MLYRHLLGDHEFHWEDYWYLAGGGRSYSSGCGIFGRLDTNVEGYLWYGGSDSRTVKRKCNTVILLVVAEHSAVTSPTES